MKIDRHFIKNQYDYARCIESVEELRGLYQLKDTSWPVCWDTETTGLSRGVPNVLFDPESETVISEQLVPIVFGLSCAFVVSSEHVTGNWGGMCIVWGRLGTDIFDEMREIIKDKQDKVWHNWKYDDWVCQESGIEVGGESHCTMTQARILWDRLRKVGLKKLTEFICPGLSQWDDPIKKELTRLKNKYTRLINAGELDWPHDDVDYANYSHISEEIMGKYASSDAFMTLMLWLRLQGEAKWR